MRAVEPPPPNIYIYIYTSSIRNNALHDLTLIKISVARFVGREGLLIRYSNSHT